MGILVSRGRLQTDDRKLKPRAKQWAKAIHGQFATIPVSKREAEAVPHPNSVSKMF